MERRWRRVPFGETCNFGIPYLEQQAAWPLHWVKLAERLRTKKMGDFFMHGLSNITGSGREDGGGDVWRWSRRLDGR